MFQTHQPPEPDKIIGVMQAFREDPRPQKIDLGVGVYRTPEGLTPVFRSVKVAEQRILDRQDSKGYVALAGDPAYHTAFRDLVLGGAVAPDRIAALATPGGTGAVRQAFDFLRMAAPGIRIWLPQPTWPNHEAILDTLGIPRPAYRYYDRETGGIDREGLFADLRTANPGDVVLLHGCCHNPTGADLTAGDWTEIGAILAERGAVPMIDLAYQGLGTGVAEDVAGLRALVSALPEALVAVSASKNFGLYRDRAGLLLAICETPRSAAAVQARLAWLNRQAFAFPPDHGARVVTEVLTDDALRADWESELAGMRARIGDMRGALAAALRDRTGSDRFGFLQDHQGMFSLIGADPDQVVRLREDFGLYMIGDGRINLAGLTPATVDPVADALAAVLG